MFWSLHIYETQWGSMDTYDTESSSFSVCPIIHVQCYIFLLPCFRIIDWCCHHISYDLIEWAMLSFIPPLLFIPVPTKLLFFKTVAENPWLTCWSHNLKLIIFYICRHIVIVSWKPYLFVCIGTMVNYCFFGCVVNNCCIKAGE